MPFLPFPQSPNPSGSATKFFDALTLKKTTPLEEREREQSIVQLGQAVPLVFGVYRTLSTSAPVPGQPLKPAANGGVWIAPLLFKAAHNANLLESSRLGYIISEGFISNIKIDDVYLGERKLTDCKSLLKTAWGYDYQKLPTIFSGITLKDGYYIKRTVLNVGTISTNDKRNNDVRKNRDVNNPQEYDDSKFVIINSLGKNIKYTKFVLKNNSAVATIDGEYTGLNGMRCIVNPFPWSANAREIAYESKLRILEKISSVFRLARKEFNKTWVDSVTYDIYYRETSPTDTANKWVFYRTISLKQGQTVTVEITHDQAAEYEYMLNPIPVRYASRNLVNLKYKPTACYPFNHIYEDLDHPLIKYGVYFQPGNAFPRYYETQECLNELDHIARLDEYSKHYNQGSRYAVVGDVGDPNKCFRPFTIEATLEDPSHVFRNLTNDVYGSDGQFTWNDETLIESLTQLEFIDVKPVTPLMPDRPGLPGTIFGSPTTRLYNNITIGAISATIQNPTKDYLSQLFIFCRNGISVSRRLGGNGASDNFADLVYYLLTSSTNMDATLIDNPSLVVAAKFTDKMGFYFNGTLATTNDLREFINTVAPFFLLSLVINDGKIGLKPVIPLDAKSNPQIGVVKPNFTVTEKQILPGSFKRNYISAEQQKPFNVVMNWRKQSPTEIGSITTTIVYYPQTPITAPYEQYDMTLFCTSEFHAIYIARYLLAARKYITHTIEFEGTNFFANKTPGNIFKLVLTMTKGSTANPSSTKIINYYMIDSLAESVDGSIGVRATHFPLDASGKSIIVNQMMSAKVGVAS